MEYVIMMIFTVALCTLLTRALPFWVLGGNRQLSPTIKYLGEKLPAAIMVILVVYCLRSTNFSSLSDSLPQILASVLVVMLHLWKKNTLMSIGAGTVFYMILVQRVFV